MATDTPATVTFQFVAPTVSSPQTLNAMLADPTYNKGRELVNGGKFDEAIDLFEALLKNTIEGTSEDSDATAPVYYQYGNALFLKAEEASSVFAEGVADGKAEGGEAEGGEAEGAEAGDEASAEDGGGDEGDDEEGEGALTDAGVESAVRDTVEANAAVVEEMEIAWEVIEVARTILARLVDDEPAAKVSGRLGGYG